MINSVNIMGRLVADPTFKDGDTPIANFKVAVDRRPDKNGERKADFIPCVVFAGTATFMEKYFHKGDMVALTGELRTNSYTDKEGIKRSGFSVAAQNVSFCGGKNEAGAKKVADDGETESTIPFAVAEQSEEDMPF